MKKNASLALVTSLALCACPVFADDEILDSAAAVREMIQSMDIPQSEKDRFLAQIQGVERIQESAIGLDIDAALQEYEIAVVQFEEADLAWSQAHDEALLLMEQAHRALDDGRLDYAEVVKDRALAKVADAPSRETLERMGERKFQLAEACSALLDEAEADGIDVSEHLARYIQLLLRSADVEQTTSHVPQ